MGLTGNRNEHSATIERGGFPSFQTMRASDPSVAFPRPTRGPVRSSSVGRRPLTGRSFALRGRNSWIDAYLEATRSILFADGTVFLTSRVPECPNRGTNGGPMSSSNFTLQAPARGRTDTAVAITGSGDMHLSVTSRGLPVIARLRRIRPLE